jgi:hypothetical protein
MIVAPWISIAGAVAASAGSVANDPDGAPTEEPANIAPTTPLIQYGVAFTVEQVISAGPLCVEPCILSSGGGIAIRVGHRTTGPLYYGLAYELSKQGSNNIYRLGILQQLRFEGRYYIETGRVTQPFLQAGAGVVGYGNEWGIETRGPMLSAGAGAQVQIARDVVLGIGLAYRALLLSSFVDSAGAARGGGVASVLGVDFQLEALDIWPAARRRR